MTGFLVSRHLSGPGPGRSRATARASYCYYSYALRIYYIDHLHRRGFRAAAILRLRSFSFSLSLFFFPPERKGAAVFSGRQFHRWRDQGMRLHCVDVLRRRPPPSV